VRINRDIIPSDKKKKRKKKEKKRIKEKRVARLENIVWI
jgi:hypothetical protein